MFGLTFLNSLFLAGLAAAALPILIHLFSKKKAKDVPFPSIEYLREVSQRKVRRMRLRQWLLLALRVLIVALFAMAMGRPAIRGTASPITKGSSTVAIVLDNSYSLSSADPQLTGDLDDAQRRASSQDGTTRSGGGTGASSGPGAGSGTTNGSAVTNGSADLGLAGPVVSEDGTLLAVAKQRAIEILDLMSDGDQGVLAIAGRPVTLPFQTPVANLALLRQEISRIGFAASGSELPAAVEQALSVLEGSRTINKELYIVSDFQRRDLDRWSRRMSRDGAPGLGALVEEALADTARTPGSMQLPDDVTVYLVPVRALSQANVGIARVRFEPNTGVSGAGRVVAKVINHSDDPVEDRVIRVLDASNPGTVVTDELFSVAPRGEADVELDLPSLPSGGKLDVRLGSDPLEWDNLAHLVTSDSGVRRVLVIGGGDMPGGRTGGGADAGPAEVALVDDRLYIQRALDPKGEAEFYRVDTGTPEVLSDPAGIRADIVVLSNVGRLSGAAVEALAKFRARGGGIFIAVGDRVDLRYYNNEVLGRLSSSIELMNIMQDQGDGTYRSLRPIAADHPVFQGFPIAPGDDLSSARFRSIVECNVGEGARVIAEFSGQIPALVEEDGLVLFTSSLDGGWNEFPTSAAFLPMIHQVVRYLAARSQGERGPRSVGDRLEALVDGASVEQPVVNQDPLGGRGQVESEPAGTMTRLRSETVPFPGFYDFVDARGSTLASFAVNLDASEGELEVTTASEQQDVFGRDSHVLEAGQPITRELLEGRYGRELWQIFLMAVLVLLAVESLLGRGRLLT